MSMSTTVVTLITKGEAILLIVARNVASYLSIAGTVVLLYDHLLLFDYECRLIWTARWTRWKIGFLMNRYIVPVCLIALAYRNLSTISSGTYTLTTCKAMLIIVTLASAISIGVVNFFVFHRIYAIWGYNKRILRFVIPPFVCVYGTAVALSIYTIFHYFIHHTGYLSSPFKECALETRPTSLVVTWTLLVVLDIYLAILAIWNAFERPRETNTVLVRQLFNDGLGYFMISITLRIFNIIVIAKLNLAYAALSSVGSWSLITATVNRVILIGTDIVWEASQQASVYQLDFIETPFAAVNPFKSITSSNEIPLAAGNGVVISSLTVEHVD